MSASSFVGQLTHNSLSMLSSIWILDSGASHHMSLDSSYFSSMSRSSSVPTMIVDGTHLPLQVLVLLLPLIYFSLSL